MTSKKTPRPDSNQRTINDVLTLDPQKIRTPSAIWPSIKRFHTRLTAPDANAMHSPLPRLVAWFPTALASLSHAAELARTIPYEILTNLNTRIPRIYR